jgi:hypothetical protein
MKKAPHDPSVEKHEIAGHHVEIRKKPREELRIDEWRRHGAKRVGRAGAQWI